MLNALMVKFCFLAPGSAWEICCLRDWHHDVEVEYFVVILKCEITAISFYNHPHGFHAETVISFVFLARLGQIIFKGELTAKIVLNMNRKQPPLCLDMQADIPTFWVGKLDHRFDCVIKSVTKSI